MCSSDLYQTRKQTTSGRNEAQINAALGLYQIEREVRMAGAGLVIRNGLLCNVGVNIHYNGVTVSNAGALRPLRIVDGANGAPDALELMRSDSVAGAAPVTVLQAMASPEAALWVDSKGGLSGNELLMEIGRAHV